MPPVPLYHGIPMLASLDSRSRRLYLLLLSDFAVYGILLTEFGAALPRILSAYGWSYTLAGVVLAAGPAGFFAATFGCGLLLQRFRPKPLFLFGLGLGAVSISLFARFPSPVLNLILNLGVGISQGFIEVVTELEVIRMETGGRSRLMALLHAGFCVGAIAGPAAVGALAERGWQIVFPASGGLLCLFILLSLPVRFPAPARDRAREGRDALRSATRPLVLLLSLLVLVYVGAELGMSSWTSEYFVKVLSSSASLGAYSLSLLWVGLMGGRILLSFGYRGTRQELVLLLLGVLCALGLAGLLLVRSTAVGMLLVFVTGLGFSGVYPLTMSLVGKHYPNGMAVGMVTMGAGIGSLVFPFLMAVIAERVGLRGGFLFFIGLDAVFLVLAAVAARIIRRGPLA
jgi:fucose permease